jgi:hypothetical protein
MSDIDTILRQIKPRVMSWINQSTSAAASTSGGVKDHGLLTGLLDDDHTQYVHISTARSITAQHAFAPTAPAAPFALNANAQGQLVTGLYADLLSKSVIAGNGLTGGGDLTANRTLNVGAGTLITVNSDDVALSNGTAQYQVPLTGGSPFTPAWSTTSDNPGGTAGVVLRTGTNGYLNLVRLNVDTLADKSGGTLTIAPTGDIVFDPTSNYILPNTGYDLNIGSLAKKYLSLHAAELWVETLVAQNTIATIGGRILMGPTTLLTKDLGSSKNNSVLNPGFETAGGGGIDVFANWTENGGTGAIARDTVIYNGGLASCKLTSGTSIDTYVYQDFALTEGKTYGIMFWTRGDGFYSGRWGIQNLNDMSWIKTLSLTGVTSTTWTPIYGNFTVPVGCTSLRLHFWCANSVGHYSWFDDVQLTSDTIEVEHNQMDAGDVAYLEANGQIEFMLILSSPTGGGPYSYYVTRDYDGSGVNNWYAGDAVFNTGTASQGFIDLYSVHGVNDASQLGPTIVGNVRNSLVFNDWIEHWAIGNLHGLYGYGSDTYGVGLGKYADASSFVTVDSTNGVRMMYRSGGVNTQLAQWATSGVITVGEVANSKSRIEISSGAVKMITRSGAGVDGTTMTLDTSGYLRIGKSGDPYTYFTNTTMSFMRSDDVAIMVLDSASESIQAGIPSNVKLDSYGVRIKSKSSPVSGRLILDDDITASDNGMLSITAGYASSGEVTADIIMDSRAGSAGYYNQLRLIAGQITGGLSKDATVDIYSAYNSSASYIKLHLGSTVGLDVIDGYDYIGQALRVLNGLSVGANVAATDKTIQMAETTAPTGSTSYGKIFMHSSYNATAFCEDDLSNDIPMGIFHNMLGWEAGYSTLTIATFNNVNGLTCTPTGNSVIDYIFPLPRGWGSKNLTVWVYCASSNTGTGNVVWAIESRRLASGVTIPSSATASGSITLAMPGVAYRVVANVSGSLSMTGFSEGDAIAFRVYRSGDNAGDTYTSNCYFLGIKISAVG